jgi:hypothetical protein
MKLHNLKIRLLGITKHFNSYELSSDPKFNYLSDTKTCSIKKYFCTFSAGYGEKLKILESVASDTKWFDNIISFNADDRELSELEICENSKKFIINNKRGYGYWLWKPYFVKYCLTKVPEDSIVCYCDVGMEISKEGSLIFDKLIQMAYDYNGLFFDMPFIEKNWTKKTVLNKFVHVDKNSNQVQANFFLLRKNTKTLALVDEWIKLVTSSDFININDDLNDEKIYFIEHRHDQSVLSCLVKSMGLKIINQIDSFDRNLYKNKIDWINKYPFHSLRSKDKNTYYS